MCIYICKLNISVSLFHPLSPQIYICYYFNSFCSVGVGRFPQALRALKILVCLSHFVNQLRWLTTKQIKRSRLVNNFVMQLKFVTVGIFSIVLIAFMPEANH